MTGDDLTTAVQPHKPGRPLANNRRWQSPISTRDTSPLPQNQSVPLQRQMLDPQLPAALRQVRARGNPIVGNSRQPLLHDDDNLGLGQVHSQAPRPRHYECHSPQESGVETRAYNTCPRRFVRLCPDKSVEPTYEAANFPSNLLGRSVGRGCGARQLERGLTAARARTALAVAAWLTDSGLRPETP